MVKIITFEDRNNSLFSLKAFMLESIPDSIVLTVQDDKQIICQAVDSDPDLIILSLTDHLIEICKALKKDDRVNYIPVIFFCAEKEDNDKRVKALDAGADAFLSSPVETTEVIALTRAMKKVKDANLLINAHVGQLTTQYSPSMNERNYRNLFEANPNPMFIFDQKTLRFLAVNDKTIQHYGYTKEEFLNMTICDIRPTEDIPLLLESVKDAGFGLRNVGYWRHLKKDKKIIWVEITSNPIVWQGEKAIAILAHDLTERKLAEDDLKTALQQLKFHEDNSPLAVIEFNDKFQITKWSNNAKNIFGWTAEEVLGKGIDEFRWVYEEDKEKVAALSAEMLASKKTSNCHTNRNYRKDGSVIICEWYNSALISSDGKLISIQSLILDITERKRAEESLNETNEFNKTLLQAIPFGMDIVNEDGTIMFANEQLKERFGREIKGEKCWALFRSNEVKCPGCPLLSEISLGKTTISESYDVFNGRIFQVSHTGMLFNGKKAILEIFQDITERKQIEAELIDAKEKAEESDQLKTAFLANMSHEIRTPLNSILGFSAMLLDPEYDFTQQFHLARMIHSSGTKLLDIINNILDISQIEAGQVQVTYKMFNLNNLFTGIKKAYMFKAVERGIDFIIEEPDAKTDIFIWSDEDKVRQVLDNFISNSLKFTKHGYIKLSFVIKDEMIVFSVYDTGIGIPVEYHKKIFEHFRQVESVNTRTHGGNGLGLAISKGLVKLLDGNLWMESEKGKGSTFYFSIPIKKSDDY